MTISEINIGRHVTALVALLCAALLVLPVPSRAEPADAITPVEDFSKQLDQLKNTFSDLGKKIDEGTKTIDSLTDVEKARTEMEQLRSAVSGLLNEVVDNGQIAQLGARAEQRVRDKIKSLETDTRFKPEERQYLLEQWRRIQGETQRASQELGTARKEFAELLRALQTNEDFIDELVQIRQAQKAIDVIRRLSSEIRDASGKLKTLIGSIKPPNA